MNIFCMIMFLIFFICNLIFIKQRKIEFEYGLLWALGCLLLTVLSVNEGLVHKLEKLTGILYAPQFLFLIGMMFCFVMIYYLMMVISKMKKIITRLIQENAILNEKIEGRLK